MRSDERQSRPSAVERERVRSLVARLELAPTSLEPSAMGENWLATSLSEVLGGGRVAVYRPACDTAGHWGLGERITSDDGFFNSYDEAVRQARTPFCYDPLRPDPGEIHRARCLHEVHNHGPDTTCVVEEMWPKIGIAAHDQLRVLICDGLTLLAWVGAIREEPFGKREQALLTALVPALQHALALRRRLVDGGIAVVGLIRAMDAIGSPAFITTADGRIDHANEAGIAMADRDSILVSTALRAAIAGGDCASFTSRLNVSGSRGRFFVVLRDGAEATLRRLSAAAKEWSATPAEVEVLRLLVAGDANKEIALKLSRSEVSVERRVTGLLRKAHCESRARLVAAFWKVR